MLSEKHQQPRLKTEAQMSSASSHTQTSANHKPIHLYDAISSCPYDDLKSGA